MSNFLSTRASRFARWGARCAPFAAPRRAQTRAVRSQKRRFALRALPLLAGSGLLALGLSGCNRPQTPSQVVREAVRNEVKAARKNLSGLQGAVLKGGQLQGGDSQGRPLWSVAADEIRASGVLVGGAPQQAQLLRARASLFRAGKPESKLQAERITLFSTPQGVRLQLREGVRGQTVGPWTGTRGAIRIAAPRADVDVSKRVIAASGGAMMSQGTLQVRAQTLRAPTSLRQVEVSGQVRAQNPDGQVEAQRATYDWAKSQLVAQNVTARSRGTTLTGQTLRADTQARRGTLSGQTTAQSAQGRASAPQVQFDWAKNLIIARDATLAGQGATLRAARLQTDSQLRVASASDLVAQQDGATLRAAFADGFTGLTRLRGRGVTYSRGDLLLTSARADASKKGASWVLNASDGAQARNASGDVRAARVTWDEAARRVVASGGVTLHRDGATLAGQTLTSDTAFQNATLSGRVRGQMRDGSTLRAGTLQKRGDQFFASEGATAQLPNGGALGTLTLRAPRIVAAADGSTARATGGVTVISSTGARAVAPQATYNRRTGKILATGGVDFFDPQRGTLHGDTLSADLGLKQVALSNGRGQAPTELLGGKKLF